MPRKTSFSARETSRPHYDDNYLPGIHHQAWSPVDDFYNLFKSGAKQDSIKFLIGDVYTKSSGPYTGLNASMVTVKTAPPGRTDLISTTVEVIDHMGCIFDHLGSVLNGTWGIATEEIAESLESGAAPGELTPLHWSADDRCCVAADGGA